MDQGPNPALPDVSSNLMALCVAVAFGGPELRFAVLSCTDFVPAASEQVAFCANFSRLSNLEGYVNPFASTFFLRLGSSAGRCLSTSSAFPAAIPSTAFQCQNIQTPTCGAGHLAPNYLCCSNLGLESSGPSGLRPGSNAWTALRLTPQPADSAFPSRSAQSCQGAKLSYLSLLL